MNCVKGEIHNVLSMMRINARWASSARFKQEIPASTQSPLMRAFKQLHYELQTVTDLSDVDTVTYLLPFIMVIESDKTSGFITGAAIASLNKFLLYGLITADSLRADVAINRIAVCVSRCRFEETHHADDEAVLMKLLELIEYTLRSDVGHLISGPNVWKMMELCYSISCQPRSSSHLARSAENTLAHMILTVFDRIDEVEAEVKANELPLASPPLSKKSSSTFSDEDPAAQKQPASSPAASAASVGESPTTATASVSASGETSPTSTTSHDETGQPKLDKPYGIPLMERILQFISTLISPHARDEATCALGLRLVNIVLETAGTGLGQHPRLVSVLQGDLSKFLLQNSETEELAILSLTLRVVFNLFNSIKDHLKVQLEVFFTSVHMRIIDSPSCSDEQKELALESLLEFCREPALMLDLYINYDCDVHCTNLFEVLCKSLARNCQAMESENGGLNALTLLCLEGLLAVIESIARRCPLNMPFSASNAGSKNNTASGASGLLSLEGSQLARIASMNGSFSNDSPLEEISPRFASIRDLMQLVMSGSDSESDSENNGEDSGDQLAWLHTARERTAEVLQQRKRAKKRYALAAEKFNTDQKNWIAYAQQLELLPATLTAESVAAFLLHTPGLNKTFIGDYLGDGPPDKKPFNAEVREKYVAMFDFREISSLGEALRAFLGRFRLPGEAQKIDRMMECFSKHFFEQNATSGPLVDADAAFVLSFSIIMLNTDLHNDQVPKKMSLEEFIRNNRGINGGQDLPKQYLTDLYHDIQQNQIQMQHDVSDLLDAATVDRYSTQWDGVLKRSENVVGASFTSNASILKLRAGLYEREMFNLIAETTLKSILIAFEKTYDITNMERALEGLANCAKIALYYDMGDMFNRIMASLSSYFLTFAHGVLNGETVFMPEGPGTPMGRPPSSSFSADSDVVSMPHHDVEPGNGGPVSPAGEEHLKGAKTRRAVLSLKLLFSFVQNRSEYFRKAWTSVVECILMFNELDVVPTSLVEMDDFVDSRGVPLPPTQPNPPSPTVGSSEPVGHTAPGERRGSQPQQVQLGAGVSGKTRERSRRVAERQAAIRSRRKHASYQRDAASNTAYGPSSGSLWDSLSSFIWAEEEKSDEIFSMVNRVLKETVARLGGGLLEKDNWLRMVRKLNEKSLLSLLEILLACRDPFKCILHPANGGTDPMVQEDAILALELSVDLILANSHRILALDLWTPFHIYAKKILSTPMSEMPMKLLVERVVVHILRVSIRLFHDEKMRPQLLQTLQLLLEMDEELHKALSDRVASGINLLLKANLVYMHDFNEWHVLLGILENVVENKNGRAVCWESVKMLAEGGYLNDVNVTLWMAICLRFVSYRTPYSVDALRMLQGLAGSDSSYRIDSCWLEVMRVMLGYLNDERVAIAKTSWDCLYNSLLLPGVHITPETWKKCFEQVIFAFDDQVSDGMWRNSGEAYLHSVTLLSKTFLHNVNTLAQLTDFRDLWLNVLRRLAQKITILSSPPPGTPSHMAMVVFETTLQSLYNLIIVLRAEQILDQCDANGKSLLQETIDIIERICPQAKEQLGLVDELPAPPAPAASIEVPPSDQQQPQEPREEQEQEQQQSPGEHQSEAIQSEASGRQEEASAAVEVSELPVPVPQHATDPPEGPPEPQEQDEPVPQVQDMSGVMSASSCFSDALSSSLVVDEITEAV